ncbi:hypothetical protein ZHAS_00020579 [Anopheles sinensis]|uniref:Uncharacterized protein n=1 Tax=Anopheles sinensis TaxID=74873 RepID=A0A084WQ74_ANOSI|nr:hypothetical protein ZHAS_00020579 [Anopheles sinensis]
MVRTRSSSPRRHRSIFSPGVSRGAKNETIQMHLGDIIPRHVDVPPDIGYKGSNDHWGHGRVNAKSLPRSTFGSAVQYGVGLRIPAGAKLEVLL